MPWIGAAIGVVGGLMGSDAAEDAASVQANAARDAAAIASKDRQPWVNAGRIGLGRLTQGLTEKGMPTGMGREFDQAGYDAAMRAYDASRSAPMGSQTSMSGREGDVGVPTGMTPTASYGMAMPNRDDFYTGTELMGTGKYTEPFGMDDFHNSEAYEFILGEGLDAVQGSASSKGGLLGTNTLRGMTKFAEGTAATFQNQAFNQWLQTLGMQLGAEESLAQTGQTAVGQVSDANANATMRAGGAQAAGIMGSSDAMTGMISNVGNQIQRQNMMSDLFGTKPTPTDMSGFYTPSAPVQYAPVQNSMSSIYGMPD